MLNFLRKPQGMGPYVEITFECRRGELTVRGAEYRPEGKNLPVAIALAHLRGFSVRDRQ